MAKSAISITISDENLEYLNKFAPNNKSEFMDNLLSEKVAKNDNFANELEKLEAQERENNNHHISIISRIENIILPEISRQKDYATEKLLIMKQNQEKRRKQREHNFEELEKLIKDKKMWEKFVECQSDQDYKEFMDQMLKLCYEKSELKKIFVFSIFGLKELKTRLQEAKK